MISAQHLVASLASMLHRCKLPSTPATRQGWKQRHHEGVEQIQEVETKLDSAWSMV